MNLSVKDKIQLNKQLKTLTHLDMIKWYYAYADILYLHKSYRLTTYNKISKISKDCSGRSG